jgi:hypothetical protein
MACRASSINILRETEAVCRSLGIEGVGKTLGLRYSILPYAED